MSRAIISKCFMFFICFVLMLSSCISMSYADTNFDDNAPTVNDFTLYNAESVDANGNLHFKIDIVEDGFGVCDINLVFANEEGHINNLYWSSYEENKEPKLLFTGIHEISIPVKNSLKNGKYELISISLQDKNANYSDYENGELNDVCSARVINIVNSNLVDTDPPKIKSISAIGRENINANKSISYNINIDDESSVKFVTFTYISTEGHEASFSWYYDPEISSSRMLQPGDNILTIPLNGEMALGEYELHGIGLTDQYNNYNWYDLYSSDLKDYKENCTLIIKKSSKVDVIAPTINNIYLKNRNIKTPGVLNIVADIVETGSQVSSLHITYYNKNRDYKTVFCNLRDGEGKLTRKITTGKYEFKCPVSPFFGEGDFELADVVIEDIYGNCTVYADYHDTLRGFEKNMNMHIDSGYNLTYFGSAANISGAVKAIKAMGEGETAVLDCSSYQKGSKDIFMAIAGKNKNVVFENGDVQWVFNGKDVVKSRCKTIKLSVNIEVKKGAGYGFPDDNKVIIMHFANNGQLPGKAEVRINNEYISAQYDAFDSGINLFYMDDWVPELEDSDVDIASDESAEIEIEHNSTYVLTEKKARLIKPTLSVKSNGLSSLKLTWSKVPGTKNYVIYRSTKKNGKYKKVVTLKNNVTRYTNKKLKSGKRYYYKVKALSGDKFTKSVYSKVHNAKVVLKAPIIKLSKSKNLKSVAVSWAKVPYAKKYTVYRATKAKGKYKKIATVSKCKYTDKKVKKGKTYYYKVRALNKQSKYNSIKSDAKYIKLKK